MSQSQFIAEDLKRVLAELGIESPPKIVLNKIPFSGEWGFASPICFQLASAEKKAGKAIDPKARSRELADSIRERLASSDRYSRLEAVNGYLNFFFDTTQLANQLVARVLAAGEEYGKSDDKGERVMIEFSQPNTHKAFHVGHLRNVCLGQSLSNILEFAGFEVRRVNYLGDIGLHVVKCLWCYLRFHEDGEPESNRGRWLGEIYGEADGKLRKADSYRGTVLSFIRRVLREEVAGPEVRKQLVSRFFARFEAALDATPEKVDGEAEWRKDLLDLLRRLWLDEPIEFNEVAHKPIAVWVWDTWLELGSWLSELEASQESEDSTRALRELIEEKEKIGRHPRQWGYARELRQVLYRWEGRDPDLVALWKTTRRWSLDEFERIYDQLGTEFDTLFYESEEEEKGKEIVEEIISKNLALDLRPNGPVVVKLDELLGRSKPDFRTMVILRADGTSLYSTKDLSLAKRKFEEFKVDRSIYVVDVGQALYFRQVFKLLELWGFEQASKCYHLAYEIVRLPSGKMSSREGGVVFYEDFFGEALRRARQSVDEKRDAEQFAELPDLDDRQRSEVALAVALGAMKYGMLDVDNNKPISFDFESALSFQGRTAPYIQYSHARCCRVIEKAGGFKRQEGQIFKGRSLQTAEINLLERVEGFGSEIRRASREYKPLYVAVYLYQLAKTFNEFYRDCPVLKADSDTRQARLALVAATRQTLANGLRLLAIPAPEYM